ncbi:MAG: hypothetical protein KC457_18920 [Myxococcales bacterium]|nr:hypothetical protein [Myxococcales bacterium]
MTSPPSRGKRFLKLAGMTASVAGNMAKTKVKALFQSDEDAAAAREESNRESGNLIAKTLGELKGAVMKVGQMASIAQDVLPKELSDALGKLQREAPPMEFTVIREQIEREELARKRAEQDELDRIAAEEAARREAEAQAAREARAVRDKRRQQQMRDRALLHRRKLASEHAEQAHREIEAGRHGTAATLFRLAHEHDPQGGYENAWRETLAIARRRRAESSFARGRDLRLANRGREAAQAYADAADADPSLRNLSEAASANAEFDPVRARDYAMLALETLQQATSQGKQLEAQIVAGVHQSCARAFLAAGQLASAKEQAERAHALAPSKHTRTLLNSIKLA